MKKFKMIAGVLLTGLLLVCAASCKKEIDMDMAEFQGWIYSIVEISDNHNAKLTDSHNTLETYYLVSGRTFAYELNFAASGNSVTRKLVTGEDEIEQRTGTFSIDNNSLNLVFPQEQGKAQERIVLTYEKDRKLFTGKVKLPKISNGEFVSNDSGYETVDAMVSFGALAKVSE